MDFDAASGAGREGPAVDEPWRDNVSPDDWEYDEELWRDDTGPGIADDDEPDAGPPEWCREVTAGTGFKAGGVLDGWQPNGVLAALVGDLTRADDQDDPGYRGLGRLGDEELTGVLKAWRRLESWCAAGGLAAVAELARRRPADGTVPELDRKLVPPGGVLACPDRIPPGQPLPSRRSSDRRSPDPASPGPASADPASAGQRSPGRRSSGRRSPGPASPGEARAAASLISGGFPAEISQFTSDEVAAALVLSGQSAERHLNLALELAIRLPGTNQALHAGGIDVLRARIIADATETLDADAAARVEALVLPTAGTMTPGQLRAATARAVLKADPDAARRRRDEAAKDARVTRWREDAGTAALSGRDLPPAEVLAADQRITDRARDLRAAGQAGTMDELRARAYLDFLLDRPLPDPGPDPGEGSAGASPGAGGGVAGGGPSPTALDGEPPHGALRGKEPARGQHPDGRQGLSGPSGLAARINLTVPLTTLLHLSDHSGEAAGFGPLDADLARAIVATASGSPVTSWCLTITDPDGRALGHGCGQRRRKSSGGSDPPGDPRWPGAVLRPAPPAIPGNLSFTIAPIAAGDCGHRHESSGYQLSARLRHLIETRSTRCTFPGCRRPARRCDQDHTLPYDQGGRTCECNLGPLCRRHHRCKQAEGWWLEQPGPGILQWHTPAGRTYTTTPTQYPI